MTMLNKANVSPVIITIKLMVSWLTLHIRGSKMWHFYLHCLVFWPWNEKVIHHIYTLCVAPVKVAVSQQKHTGCSFPCTYTSSSGRKTKPWLVPLQSFWYISSDTTSVSIFCIVYTLHELSFKVTNTVLKLMFSHLLVI